MEPEPEPQVNSPAVLINSEGLYVIIAVLGVSILGCACVLTYSFTNYNKLKKNAEEVRNFIASRTKLNEIAGAGSKEQLKRQQPAEHVKAPSPIPPASVVNIERQPGASATVSNKTYALVDRQEAPVGSEQQLSSRDGNHSAAALVEAA
ncbi:uncharacterized protein LOC135367841 [Ornithodoros turicata]|uniref:uncharacterized protein LOC135367841 n=1 Tax=Ornithodoros turicata TaxID=34597 RepID=UPI0031394AF7